MATAQGLAPRSVRKYHVMLHSIFQRAVRDQLILTNPCEHTELPKVVLRRSRTLTPEEFDHLIQAIPEPHRLMVETAIETGNERNSSSGARDLRSTSASAARHHPASAGDRNGPPRG